MAADKPTLDPLSKLYAEWVSAAVKMSVASFDASAKIMEASMQSMTAARAKAHAEDKAKPAAAEAKAQTRPAPAAPKLKVVKAEPVAKTEKPKTSAKVIIPEVAPLASKASAKLDDLKLISGIGPKLEQMLLKKGINSFAAIAALSPADATKLDDDMGLNGRIQRDDWVGQAAKLAG